MHPKIMVTPQLWDVDVQMWGGCTLWLSLLWDFILWEKWITTGMSLNAQDKLVAQSKTGGGGSVPASCPCAQVALDVIEELCCEMGLQNPEALEEYILFVVTDRGEELAGKAQTGQDKTGRDSHARWCGGLTPGCHRAERAATDPPRIRPGRGSRDGAPGQQLHLLVPPRGLEPAPQVRQRALRHRPLQPGRATPSASPRASSLSPSERALSPSRVPVLCPPPQVLPDYLKGLFTVLPPARPGEQHFPHVAKLAALQHRAKDRHHLPTAYGRGQGTWRGGTRVPWDLGPTDPDLGLPAGGRCRTTSLRSSSAC